MIKCLDTWDEKKIIIKHNRNVNIAFSLRKHNFGKQAKCIFNDEMYMRYACEMWYIPDRTTNKCLFVHMVERMKESERECRHLCTTRHNRMHISSYCIVNWYHNFFFIHSQPLLLLFFFFVCFFNGSLSIAVAYMQRRCRRSKRRVLWVKMQLNRKCWHIDEMPEVSKCIIFGNYHFSDGSTHTERVRERERHITYTENTCQAIRAIINGVKIRKEKYQQITNTPKTIRIEAMGASRVNAKVLD